MSTKSIGRLISINTDSVVGEIQDDLGNYINTRDGINFVGEVGSYLSIHESNRTLILEVVGVSDRATSGNNDYSRPTNTRYVALNMVGEITSGEFQFGVSRLPQIYSDLQIISTNELRTMLEVGLEESTVKFDPSGHALTKAILLDIGQSVVFPDYPVRVNIDRFFGFHFAVFGNTGAGKSNTIARILQNVFEKNELSAKGAKIVLIDSNGEYSQAFSKINSTNPDIQLSTLSMDSADLTKKKLEIPVWALSADDWAVLLSASEKTQLPVLRRAISIARILYDKKNTNEKLKAHIVASATLGILRSSDSSPSKSDKATALLASFGSGDLNLKSSAGEKELGTCLSISYGNFKDEQTSIEILSKHIDPTLIYNNRSSALVPYSLEEFASAVDFAVMYEGSLSTQRIQEYTATLTTRLQSLIEGNNGNFLKKTSFATLNQYIENLLGSCQIVDIDISSLDDSSGEVITKVLAKLLLDYLKSLPQKASMPINLIIEEAHRYIRNEQVSGALSYNIFERIAKEGRKYGLLLGISSQRPSELSKTVVSQCSNFIIHRVQNPDDLQYISRMVPYINKGIIERLTYLQTGTAIVFGTAINLPTLTSFIQAEPRTDSASARISDHWYIE